MRPESSKENYYDDAEADDPQMTVGYVGKCSEFHMVSTVSSAYCTAFLLPLSLSSVPQGFVLVEKISYPLEGGDRKCPQESWKSYNYRYMMFQNIIATAAIAGIVVYASIPCSEVRDRAN